MNKVTSVVSFAVGIALVGLVFWAVIRGVEHEPGVVGSFATAAAAAGGLIWQRRYEKREELEQRHRDRLVPVYERLLETMKGERDHTENVTFFKSLHNSLMLYGSTPVIKKWLEWTATPDIDDPADITSLMKWEEVIFAIRADLGHDNAGLEPGDLIRIYVPEVAAHLPEWRAQHLLK